MREDGWLHIFYFALPTDFDFAVADDFLRASRAMNRWLITQPDFDPGGIESYELFICFPGTSGGIAQWPSISQSVAPTPALAAASNYAQRSDALVKLTAQTLAMTADEHSMQLPAHLETSWLTVTAVEPPPPALRTREGAALERTVRRAKRKT